MNTIGKYFFIFLILLPMVLQGQPQFTGFRTIEEVENEQWYEKITETDTLEHYIVQLVTSKTGDDYSTQRICLQILDHKTNKLVQIIDLSDYEASWFYDRIASGDFNFDGYEDFSMLGGCGSLDNCYSFYFLFDPQTGTFFDGGFDGTNLEFDSESQTITSRNRCCAGLKISEGTYKVINNAMVLLEQHCLTGVMNEQFDDYVVDQDGELIFEEEDCYTPYLDLQLQSVGLKKNFQLRMAIYDEEMYGGFVQYKTQNERIPIHFDHAEIVESRENEGRPDIRQLFYNEMYEGKNNGVYSFVMQGANIYEAYYIRKKDNKKFILKVIDS